MQNFVNIKHFKEDINSIDIYNATILSVAKDKEIKDKNEAPVRVSELQVKAGEDTFTVRLWGKWRSMAEYLSVDDCINIIDGKSRDFDESGLINVLDTAALSYVVLEPSILIDATKMAGVAIRKNHFCFLKYHQRRIRIENIANYYVIKGNITGLIFDDFLGDINNFDFDVSFNKYLENEKVKFVPIDFVPTVNNIRKEVKEDIKNLTDWYLNGNFNDYEKFFEPDFISPKYGLKGRMDIIFKDRAGNEDIIIELKTGRSPEEKTAAWMHHQFQVLAYDLIYDSVFSKDTHKMLILYSSSKDTAREISFKSELKRDFIFLRNKMVYYEKRYKDFDYDTLISFKRAPKDCLNCPSYLRKSCNALYETFDKLDDDQRRYYFALFRAVEYEREASIRKNRLLWDKDIKEQNDNGLKKYVINDLTLTSFLAEESVLTFDFPENVSEIRLGDAVVLHTGDPIHEQLFKGKVTKLNKNSITVKMSHNYSLAFDRDKKWTLNRFDYMLGASVMLDGLFKFADATGRFKDLIMLKSNPEFDTINIIKRKNDGFSLNEAQTRALKKSICSRDYFLLQGPPGTGKTKTIACIINELTKRKERVLLSALTNRAVDNVLLRLTEDHGFTDFIRIGNGASVDERLHDHLISTITKDYEIKDIKKLKKRIKKCPVIATTTTSASLSAIIDSLDFDVAVIDEASQIPEPSIFSSITKTKRFILVGDIYQLGPVTRSEYEIEDEDDRVAGIKGLGKTLFERLWDHNKNRYDIEEDNNPLETLDIQYRMNAEIVKFSNMKFYGDVLQTDESVRDGRIDLKGDSTLSTDAPVVFIDVKGDSAPRENEGEAKIVSDLVKELIGGGVKGADIGIISPFKAQCALIRRMIEPENFSGDILVDTVERFQGSERDVIITSFVVSNEKALEFLRENDTMNRKLNVTITRAKKKLILIGNKKVLSNDPVYAELASFIDKSTQDEL
jgi:DNA replication ATP-dependent helicase Dna2